jgi:hypothetical protein
MSLTLLQILSNSAVGFCLLFTDFQKAARKRVSFLLRAFYFALIEKKKATREYTTIKKADPASRVG